MPRRHCQSLRLVKDFESKNTDYPYVGSSRFTEKQAKAIEEACKVGALNISEVIRTAINSFFSL